MSSKSIALFPLFALTGCLHLDLSSFASQRFEEHVIEDNDAGEKIALVLVSGVMTTEEQDFFVEQPNIVAETREQLELAAEDPHVRAVLLQVSSPGGGVYPSLAIHREILRFRARTHKPVIAFVPELAASGGYMAVSAADQIVVDPAGLVGGIGVISGVVEVQGLLEWAKIKVHVLKSGKYKDLGSPFREFTEEDREIIQTYLNYYYEQFKEVVAHGRSKLAGKIDSVAEGLIYTAKDAVTNGLADEVGDIYAAHARCAKASGLDVEKTNLIAYRRGREYSGSVFLTRSAPRPAGDRISLELSTSGARPGASFMYLWSWK